MSNLPTKACRTVLLFSALSLALAAAGCESMDKLNPFTEKEKPLPGARSAVFPEGVPGVDYNAPPEQPANSTIYEPAPASPAGGAAQ